MGYIAAGAAVLGAVVSAVGTIGAGQAAAANANYQAQVAQNNATIANQNAQHALEAGQANAEQKSLQGAAQIGAIKADEAANGVDVNSGSALDVQTSQRELNKLGTLNTENAAQLTAYGYRAQASQYLAQAQLDQTEANQASDSSYLSAAGSLLGGASSIGTKFGGLFSGSNSFPSDGSPAIGGYFGGAT